MLKNEITRLKTKIAYSMSYNARRLKRNWSASNFGYCIHLDAQTIPFTQTSDRNRKSNSGVTRSTNLRQGCKCRAYRHRKTSKIPVDCFLLVIRLETKAMLLASVGSVVTLCLACFLSNVEFLRCRSTARQYEYTVDLIGACLRSCGALTAELKRTKS